ncbi:MULTISPECIES: NADP-dependent oxidoreductase [Rhodopseudomonas]|uniref:Enoyl reductase (ER) domain-containing protein n=1 Tax=Rhodopseudomonas palustris TaxID=1076 RepID=A0A0D7ES90_RHOPL|nr:MULTISPECIES: NADP-dependent oxidoreductase [Rhodopseudomonas]KIZ43673.1 hypothetical protein OO17_11010 [Rhodopseudomonas palustris]MDF3810870.1 NADP-dependent oxidoreductase [Rhodopseudomonas sp. BAL398]WOK15563.1 NADP-dependent oxidoreductase [Rhodopseudomonas sp. BAL398]
MRGFVLSKYGAVADCVRLSELADPVASAGQLVVEIHAASLNPIDYKLIRGDLQRIAKYRLPHPIGFDASGVVLSVGFGATRFAPGDAVYFRTSREHIGTFAEQIATDERLVAARPASVSHLEAASLPLVGLTTLQGFARAGAKAGQRILIQAGSGGVGSFAVQYARHLGLEVTATTSAKNADFVRALGADRVIAYDREDYRAQGAVYDIVFDTLGDQHTIDAFKVVTRGGTVISLSGPPDRDFGKREDTSLMVRIAVWLMGRKVYAAADQAGAAYCWYFTEANGDQLRDIAGLVDADAIKPVIDRVFDFAQLPQAMAHLQAGHARGKVVLKVR